MGMNAVRSRLSRLCYSLDIKEFDVFDIGMFWNFEVS